jgi:hypothetical protein
VAFEIGQASQASGEWRRESSHLPVEGRNETAQSPDIAALHFLIRTIAGVRSSLRRVRDTALLWARPKHSGPAPMRRHALAADSCYLCGGTVEEGLARLGSTLCHDCRRGSAHLAPSERT